MPQETPVLWHLEVSHYNEKVRWALDYKRVRHVRRAVTPALQELRARRLRAGRTVPILQLNGRAIGDSTRIIEEIERQWPEPPLYPSDPEERRRALELEEYFDESCGHDLRRVLFNDNLAEPEKFLGMLYGPDHPRIGLLKALSPMLIRVVKWRYAIQPDRVAHSREKLYAFIDSVAGQINRPAVSAMIDPDGISLNVTGAQEGQAVQKRFLAARILRELRNPSSSSVVEVPVRPLRPHVSNARYTPCGTRASFR